MAHSITVGEDSSRLETEAIKYNFPAEHLCLMSRGPNCRKQWERKTGMSVRLAGLEISGDGGLRLHQSNSSSMTRNTPYTLTPCQVEEVKRWVESTKDWRSPNNVWGALSSAWRLGEDWHWDCRRPPVSALSLVSTELHTQTVQSSLWFISNKYNPSTLSTTLYSLGLARSLCLLLVSPVN